MIELELKEEWRNEFELGLMQKDSKFLRVFRRELRARQRLKARIQKKLKRWRFLA